MISILILSYAMLSTGVFVERFIDQRDSAHKLSHCFIEGAKAAFAWPYELQRVIRMK